MNEELPAGELKLLLERARAENIQLRAWLAEGGVDPEAAADAVASESIAALEALVARREEEARSLRQQWDYELRQAEAQQLVFNGHLMDVERR